MFLLVFQGKNLFRFIDSNRGEEAVSKNTYYRFLNASTYNWKKFLLLLSTKVATAFNRLTLGWSDGYSFIPTGFKMLSSANGTNRYQDISTTIDKRTNGYKRRVESLLKKPEVALQLIQEALAHGIKAYYVLMDTWFTNEPRIKAILEEGLDVIGMVLKGNAKYCYKGKLYDLKARRN